MGGAADDRHGHIMPTEWDMVNPPIGVDLAMVGLEEIGVYTARRQNTVAQYIETRPIMD